MNTSSGRFGPRAEVTVLAVVEVVLTALAVGATVLLDRVFPLEPFAFVLVAYGVFAGGTMVVLRIVRGIVPLVPGVYSPEENPRVLFAWRVFNYLAMNNLFFHYQNGLLPAHLRKFFSRWLGMNAGGGIISIAGVVVDPYLITLEADTMVGQDASLLPSLYENGRLTLGTVVVRRGAVIGARSVVLPGVSIGRGAMVKAMSVVAENTVIGDGEVWGGVPARKMGQIPVGGENRFSTWRDLLVSGTVETAILTAAGIGAWAALRRWSLGFFEVALVFYVAQTAVALGAEWVIRRVWPFREGVYNRAEHPWACLRWNLFAFIGITNLFSLYQRDLIPPVLRFVLHRLMGARIRRGRGHLSAIGIVLDPFFVTMDNVASTGYDALLLPHALAVTELHLRAIRVGENAIVGERAVLMPGVEVGAGAEILPMTLVTAGTRVPPGTRWGGVPARNLGPATDPGGFVAGRPLLRSADIFWTVLAEALIISLASLGVWVLSRLVSLDLFLGMVSFYGFMVGSTLAVLAGLRRLWPLPEGEYYQEKDGRVLLVWKLHAFLCITNLFLHYQNGLVPPEFRRLFLRLLGLTTERGRVRSLPCSLVADPYMVTLERDASLGHDVLLLPGHLTGGRLQLRRIRVGRGASIGARAMLLPGVTLGEGARVEPLSLVEAGTTIGPGERWGGVPARRLD